MHERRIVRVAAAAAYALIAVIALACGGSGDAGGTAVRAAGPPPAEATPPPEVSVGVGWDTAPLIRDYGSVFRTNSLDSHARRGYPLRRRCS